MEKIIRGKAYVLGDAIDTDQIIPAEHLVYSLTKPDEKRLYGRYALSGVPVEGQGLPHGNIPFTQPDAYTSEIKFIIGGGNFGYGSSREHVQYSHTIAVIVAVIVE